MLFSISTNPVASICALLLCRYIDMHVYLLSRAHISACRYALSSQHGPASIDWLMGAQPCSHPSWTLHQCIPPFPTKLSYKLSAATEYRQEGHMTHILVSTYTLIIFLCILVLVGLSMNSIRYVYMFTAHTASLGIRSPKSRVVRRQARIHVIGQIGPRNGTYYQAPPTSLAPGCSRFV